jgi:CTP:molybdopterin cytidylyltransferase MocA
MIAALILAAGESRRMQQPKALLKIGAESFVESIARKCVECGIQAILLILGGHAEEIAEHVRDKYKMQPIINDQYREGQITSLKKGIRNLPSGCTHALIWPVDQPLVNTGTVQALIEDATKKAKHLTIPVYNSRRGHPVIYDDVAMNALLSLGRDQTAKELQPLYRDSTSLVEVKDEGVVVDIDTPEDYKRYINSVR